MLIKNAFRGSVRYGLHCLPFCLHIFDVSSSDQVNSFDFGVAIAKILMSRNFGINGGHTIFTGIQNLEH